MNKEILERSVSRHQFECLLDYYIKCIEQEEIQSLTFNFKSENKGFFSDIFKKEEFFQKKKEQVVIKKTGELSNFLQSYKTVQRGLPLFYGYPLFIDTNGKVSPLFFVEVFFKEGDDSVIFTKASVTPEFNHYILASLGYGVEEINRIRAEADERDDFSLKVDGIQSILKLEQTGLTSELSTTALEIPPAPALINKTMLYVGKRTGITRGLLDELEKLKTVDLASTAINYVLNPSTIDGTDKEAAVRTPLEILSLNDSQEEAMLDALRKPMTVVTGPPGTGKSQVVLNILANAVWNDQTVLFASKNNQAVDVVIEKMGSILSKNLVVRMGNVSIEETRS